MRRRTALIVGCGGLALLAGCGGESSSLSSTTVPAASAPATVSSPATPAAAPAVDPRWARPDQRFWSLIEGATAALVCGPLADDDFTDFRSWIVLHGRAVHAKVLADPGALADVPDARGTGEVFAATAEDVYRQRTGRDLSTDRPDLVIEPDTAPAGPPVSDDEARRRWPRLAQASTA